MGGEVAPAGDVVERGRRGDITRRRPAQRRGDVAGGGGKEATPPQSRVRSVDEAEALGRRVEDEAGGEVTT